MKPFRWPPDKNALLKQGRGVSFEDITVAVEAGSLLATRDFIAKESGDA